MPMRICPNCSKSFVRKHHYEYHINPNRKNACLQKMPKMIPNDPKSSQMIPMINDSEQEDRSGNFECNYCNKNFTLASNLKRHLNRSCKVKRLEDNYMQNQLKIKDMEIKLIREKLEILEKENEFHKQLVMSAGNIIQNSMSALKYLTSNYNNAPLLEPLKNYSIIEDKNELIDIIIFYYDKGKLHEYLGKYLLKHYKNKDPAKRANWSTDPSRLTYINRLLVNNNASWVVDKKGADMTDIIIEPFLKHIKKLAQEYINKFKEDIENNDNDDSTIILKKMQSLAEIINIINNDVLAKSINKYLAPHLYLDKNYPAIKSN